MKFMPPARKKRKTKRKVKTVKVSPWVALGLAAGVILVILMVAGPWRGDRATERGAKVPPGSWRYGMDISHHNSRPIIWDSLYVMTDKKRRTIRDPYSARDIKPVSFVFIKATEGASFVDPDFKNNWRDAGRSTLRRGAYHFFLSDKDGETQARNFIAVVGDLRLKDLPPVLDIETIHKGCSKELLNKRALQWLEAVEKHYGKKPVVYASSSFIKDHLSKDITGNYPIWVAHYGRQKPGYDNWTWWQFTDKGVIKGVKGPVDLNVMRTD